MTPGIAEHYQEFLDNALAEARRCSGKLWDLEHEHDPGLTMLEIAANAAALVDAVQTAEDGGGGFHPPRRAPAWELSPARENVFVYRARGEIPAPEDFRTLPVTERELRDSAEAVPGVRKAWLKPAPAAAPRRTMYVELSPIVCEPAPLSIAPFIRTEPETAERKRFILQAARERLAEAKGVCGPSIDVREARYDFCELSIRLETVSDSRVRRVLRALPETVGRILRPDAGPLAAISATVLSGLLHERLRENGMPDGVVRGVDIVGLFRPGGERNGSAGGALLELTPGCDAFFASGWRIAVCSDEGERVLTEEEIGRLLVRSDADQLRPASTPQPALFRGDGGAVAGSGEKRTHAVPVLLHRQFPEAYRLNEDADNLPEPTAGESRQFQGWLLFFEQMLAEALHLSGDPARLFSPARLDAAVFIANADNPLWNILAAKEYSPEKLGESLLPGEARRRLDMRRLQFLSALQGEREGGRPPRRRVGEEELDAAGLLTDALPRLNGMRGAALIPPPFRHFFAGQHSPLAARLSLLIARHLGIFRLPQRFFSIVRDVNPRSGQKEYRCYIASGPSTDEDGRGGVRLIVNHLARSVEEAEALGLHALRFATMPCRYHAAGNRLQVGMTAEISGEYYSGDRAEFAEAVRKNTLWARSLMPPWVRVFEHPRTQEGLSNKMTIVLERRICDTKERQAVAALVLRHVPAHLLADVCFVGNDVREEMDRVLSGSDDGFVPPETPGAGADFAGIRELLEREEGL